MRTLQPPRGLRTLLLSFGLLPAVSWAQEPLPLLDDYHIRVFTVADGLPGSEVRALVQGADGYLYVGGARGVVRFDGYRLQPVPAEGFETRRVAWLGRDPEGRVWVQSRLDDLGVVEDGRVRALPRPPGAIRGISWTSDGTAWLGTPGGLVRVDPQSPEPYETFGTADGLPDDDVLGVVESRSGERLVVTRTRLARLDLAAPEGTPRMTPFGRRFQTSNSLLRQVVAVGDDGLWLAVHDGALRFADGRFSHRVGSREDPPLTLEDVGTLRRGSSVPLRLALRVRLPPSLPGDVPSSTRKILVAGDRTRWIFAREASIRRTDVVRERDGRLETLDLSARLEFAEVLAAVEDHEGSIWLGTDRGLVQLAPRRVAGLGRRHGLAETFTTAVLQTTDGSVWVGTWGGGLHRFRDGRLEDRFTMAHGLPAGEVRSLHQGSDGALWIGTWRGVAVLRNDSIETHSMSSGHVRAFAETEGDPDGRRLWVAQDDRLLVGRPGPDPGFVDFRPEYDWGAELWALHTDRTGALWVAGTGGLHRIAGDSVRRLGERDGLRDQAVVSIHEEDDGTLWFGTYEHGLHRYRDGRFAPITTRVGLHHDGVWRMLHDDAGGVWMSSDVGIFRVERDRLHAVADAVERGEPTAERLAPLVLTEAAGMPTRESNRASPGGWRLADGRLVFNNVAGLAVIDPERAVGEPPRPRTALQSVAVDGRPVASAPDGVPRLPAGARHISFAFAALSFAAPDLNRYRYRLDGYDDGWIDGGTNRQAQYTGLDPGRYTFRVQSAAGAGEWGEQGVTYAFVVPPLVWQTWWFRGGVLVLVAALGVAAYRYRVARLLEVERLRLRIASDLHDDVGSNLSSIALLSEMLRDRTRLDGLERRQLERISRAAGETIGSLREIIWLVDPKHDNLADLIRRMRSTAADLANGTACTFRAPESPERHPLDPSFVRQAFLIYKEALHNAVRHAGAGRVDIEVARDGNRLVLRVEDDGAGFRPPRWDGSGGSGDRGFSGDGAGLESMRRRAGDVGGELEIESSPGRGTRVTFRARMA